MSDTNENTTTEIQTTVTNTETTVANPAAETQETSDSGKFIETLPDDLKNEPSLSAIKDVKSLAKGYVSAQRMLGSSIRIPGPDASEETKAEFYKKLSDVPGVVKIPDEKDEKGLGEFYARMGRPQTPDGYKVELPDPLKDDEIVNKEVGDFKQFAHKLGLNSKQAASLVQYQVAKAQAQVNEKVEELKAAETFLKQTWGTEYSNKLTTTKELLKHYEQKYPDAVRDLRYGEAGRNPVFLMMAAELGRVYKETGAIQGGSALSTGLTPDEARERIAEMRSNKAHPLHDPMSPGHKEAVEKMTSYYKAVYGDGPQGE